MEEKFADLVIQEIHTLGRNVSKLDRKLDIQLKQVYDEIKENKKCNEKAHALITEKQDGHILMHLDHDNFHVDCKKDCTDRADGKVSTSMFKWIIGGLLTAGVASVITIAALGLETQTTLARHIYFAEFIYHEVTGQKWSGASRDSLLKAKEQFDEHMKKMDEMDKNKNKVLQETN